MAKENKKGSSSSNGKVMFGKSSNAKRTSIGSSRNSRPKDKNAVRQKKGR